MRLRLVLAVALLTVWSGVAPAQRLSRIAIPDHYEIHLSPDFTTDTFGGEVAIRVRLSAPTQSITLNAAEIDFHEVRITGGGTSQPATVTLDAETETATLTVPQMLPAGMAAI